MVQFIIEAKYNIPEINFNPESGVMLLKGKSTPENSVEFYDPINRWILEYLKSPAESTIVKIQFEYFNTSSSKCILDVLKKFGEIHKTGGNLKIEWYYEEDDEDMKETAEDYSDIVKIPFDIIQIAED